MRYNYRSANAVWFLIGACVLVFIFTTLSPDLTFSLGLVPALLEQRPWTLVTSMFVHGGFTHILFNMITLYFFGTFLLELISTKWFLLVYFIGGIAGNLVFILLGPGNSLVVGASGAIYAIGGTLMVMRPNVRVLFFLFPMPLWIAIIVGFLLTFGAGGIAWQAHLGGLIVGLMAGYYFRQRERRPIPRW